MQIKNPVLHSLGHAVLVAGYVSLVATIMTHGEQLFKQDHSVLAPIAFLMLFVLSAAIVGALVLGRPAMMYLAGDRSGGMKFFGYTIGWLVLATLIVFLLNLK